MAGALSRGYQRHFVALVALKKQRGAMDIPWGSTVEGSGGAEVQNAARGRAEDPLRDSPNLRLLTYLRIRSVTQCATARCQALAVLHFIRN